MIRNLKALGLAAFALLAMGAMMAPGAQAEVTLTASATTSSQNHTSTSVYAVQRTSGDITTNKFFIPLTGSLTCNNTLSTFTGTTNGTAKTLTITPHYTHCNTITSKHTLGTPVTVDVGATPGQPGCDFSLNQPVTTAPGKYQGTVDVVCPAGKQITLTFYAAGTVTAHANPICTLTIAAQKGIGHVAYTNVTGSPDDIEVDVTGTGIAYTKHGLCGNKVAADATYDSHLTLTAPSTHLWFSD